MSSVLSVSRVLSRIFWNGFANLNTNATNSNFSNLALDPSLSSSSSSNRHYAASFSQTSYLNVVLLNAKPSSFFKAAITRAVKPRLITAVCGFPKYRAPKKFIRGKYGDDAWFKSCSPKADVLGVADGVGGWRAHGIDPGEFPTSLMRTCERHVKVGLFSPENPLELLKKSYHEMYHSPKSVLGSSTACVVILNRNNSTVYTSNIGDSGFIIVRKGHVILRSREQQHYFNTPFQLSLPPPVHRNSVLIDQPDDAQIANIRVRSGDVILLASDGVFDNLPERIIIHEMSKVQGMSSGVHIQMVANSIAWMSRCLSYDQSFLSPFSKSAFSNGIFRVGGKPDDITVLLATVVV